MTTIKEIYENNIGEDIVDIRDTLKSKRAKITKKLESDTEPMFLVVLDDDTKIVGVITNSELKEMIEEVKRCSSLDIKFKDYAKKHITLKESEDAVKGLEELKKIENKGFILITNDAGNYVGKLSLSTITKK
jgi:predicted transcriptional regulator